MAVSNNFLVLLLVIVLIVAIVGTVITIDKVNKFSMLTGFGTTGQVNVTISNQTTINVTATECNFGTGYVTPPYSFAVLYPGNSSGLCTGTDTSDNWTVVGEYDPNCIEVRNDGNLDLVLNVSSGKTTDAFIGGNSALNEYKVWSANKEPNACKEGLVTLDNAIEMDTNNKTICTDLNPGDANDEIYVGCYLKIPDDAWGTKGDIWTFWAAAA